MWSNRKKPKKVASVLKNNKKLNQFLYAEDTTVAIDFWFVQETINLNDERKWKVLKDHLGKTRGKNLGIEYMKKDWIQRVDPRLPAICKVDVKELELYDRGDDTAMEKKLEICSRRLTMARHLRTEKFESALLADEPEPEPEKKDDYSDIPLPPTKRKLFSKTSSDGAKCFKSTKVDHGNEAISSGTEVSTTTSGYPSTSSVLAGRTQCAPPIAPAVSFGGPSGAAPTPSGTALVLPAAVLSFPTLLSSALSCVPAAISGVASAISGVPVALSSVPVDPSAVKVDPSGASAAPAVQATASGVQTANTDAEATSSSQPAALSGVPASLSGVQAALSGGPAALSGDLAAISGDSALLSGVPAALAGVPDALSGFPVALPGVLAAPSGTPVAFPGVSAALSGVPAALSGVPAELSGVAPAYAGVPAEMEGNHPKGIDIKFHPNVPLTFRSSDVGADCENLLGWAFPRQQFEGLSFHVLKQIGDYADAAAAVGHEYFIKVHGGNIVASFKNVNTATIVIASKVKRYNELMFQTLKQSIILPEALYILLSNPATETIQRFTHLDFIDYVFWPKNDNFVHSVENKGPQPRTPENKDMVNDVKQTGDEAGVESVKQDGIILPSESHDGVKLNQTTTCDADAIDELAPKRKQKVPEGIHCEEVAEHGPIECTPSVSIPKHSCTSLNDSVQSIGQSPTKQEGVLYTSIFNLEPEDESDDEYMRVRINNYFEKKEAEMTREHEESEASANRLMDKEKLAKIKHDPKFKYRQIRALAFMLAGTQLNMSVWKLARVVDLELAKMDIKGGENEKDGIVAQAEETKKNKEPKRVENVRWLIRAMVENKKTKINPDWKRLEDFFNKLKEEFQLTPKMLEDITLVFKNRMDE